MISKARDQILGEYFLNSFIIKCNVDIDFENLSNSDTYLQLGSFLHEYIHFLQNASTTYGYINMAYFYAKTMNILYKVKNNAGKEVKRIIRDSSEIEQAGNICNITMGCAEAWTYDNYNYIEIINTVFQRDNFYGEEYDMAVVPILKLRLVKDGKSETKDFEFGAMAIMESMSSILERHFYGTSYSCVQPQYDICKILWNYIAPQQYADREDLIVAACECSLMYENPGSLFYNIVKHIISKEKKELAINDIVDIFKSSFKPSFDEQHKIYFDEMNRLFGDLVPHKNDFCKFLNNYVTDFCNKLFLLRKYNFHFLSDLMIKSSSEAKQGLIAIMKNTKAIPLIISNNYEIYSGHEQTDKMGMINYLAIYSFNRMFGVSGKNQCYMVDVCKRMGDSMINDKCYTLPMGKS